MGNRGRIDVRKILPIGSEPSEEPCFSLTLNPAEECRCWKPGDMGNAAWRQLPKVLAGCNSLVSDSVLLGRPGAGKLTSLDFENASHWLGFECDKWPSRAGEQLTARQDNEKKTSSRIQTLVKDVLHSTYRSCTGKQCAVAFLFYLF